MKMEGSSKLKTSVLLIINKTINIIMETIKEINTLKTKVVFVFKLILLTTISYVKAQDFIVTDNGVRSLNRDSDTRKDFANVFYKPQYTLFDLWSDEPIFSDSKGDYHIYFATNENKSPIAYTGYANMLEALAVYKFKNYENCKKWCQGENFVNNKKIKEIKNYLESKNNRFYPINGVVEIIGLDNTEPEDMRKTAQIIEEYFGYETFISKNISIQDGNYLFNTEIIDGETFINNYKKNSLTIYITNKNIQALNIDVRGVSRIKGSVILLQNGIFMHETLIHEMGHIFGLYHCDNLRCVMAIKNDEYDEGKFCDKCMNSIANN